MTIHTHVMICNPLWWFMFICDHPHSKMISQGHKWSQMITQGHVTWSCIFAHQSSFSNQLGQSCSSRSWTLLLLYHLVISMLMIMFMIMLVMVLIAKTMMIISSIIITMVTVGGAGKNKGTGSWSATGDLKLGEKLPGRILHFFDILEYSMWTWEIINFLVAFFPFLYSRIFNVWFETCTLDFDLIHSFSTFIMKYLYFNPSIVKIVLKRQQDQRDWKVRWPDPLALGKIYNHWSHFIDWFYVQSMDSIDFVILIPKDHTGVPCWHWLRFLIRSIISITNDNNKMYHTNPDILIAFKESQIGRFAPGGPWPKKWFFTLYEHHKMI